MVVRTCDFLLNEESLEHNMLRKIMLSFAMNLTVLISECLTRAMDLRNKIIFASRETLPKSDELDYSINTFPEQYKMVNAIRFFERK